MGVCVGGEDSRPPRISDPTGIEKQRTPRRGDEAGDGFHLPSSPAWQDPSRPDGRGPPLRRSGLRARGRHKGLEKKKKMLSVAVLGSLEEMVSELRPR